MIDAALEKVKELRIRNVSRGAKDEVEAIDDLLAEIRRLQNICRVQSDKLKRVDRIISED